MTLKILKYSSFILLTAIITTSGLLLNHFKSAEAESDGYDFAGWAYSDNYGWISLSSKNCVLLNEDPDNKVCSNSEVVDYGVKIDSGNKITGYAWSENVGWICFGSTCTSNTPDGSPSFAEINESTGKITGWAQIVGMGEDGWIKISQTYKGGGSIGGDFGEACYNCQPVCEAWTQQLSEDDPPVFNDVEPCIKYSDTEFEECAICFTNTKYNGSNIPESTESVIGGSGYICNNCLNCHKPLDEGRIVCNKDDGYDGSCSNCEFFGAVRNADDGKILGWSWNGDASGFVGAGWVHFNPRYGSGFIVFPWLQTIYGSIYGNKYVRQRAGAGGNNATYCIFADDINANIKTANCEDIADGLIKDVKTNFPSTEPSKLIYRNALGKIDIQGLKDKTAESGEIRNKYGHLVNTIDPSSSWTGPDGETLKGQVYYFDSDLTINNLITFKNGTNVSGNGIIIVNGNLNINSSINYTNEIPGSLNELASVAWIVMGDVIIDPSVESVAGAFMVLGNGTACQKVDGSDASYPNYKQTGCGVFYSGDSNTSLTVLGLIMARAFDFERTFSALEKGSERVIYDGRLIANPPPGLEGFVEGLPIIRDFSY